MIIEQILDKNNKMLSSYPFNPALGKLNTPYNLVHEMIKRIPESVFISNDTKFLDPCAGTGTFIIEILRKLLKYKTYDIAIKQVYMCEISRPISSAFLSNILPKTKINIPTDNNFINDFFSLIIKEITGGEKTFNDLYYIIHNEDIKNQLNEMKLKLTSFIEKYEKLSKLESKLFGEVFTPKRLIEEMLNQFPKEIWTNKSLKWLDPAVGIGNFPAIVVEKLMEGLKEEIPSESERYKWIMEEMIYMVDISTKNLFLLYKLFDENNNLKLNVHRGSFLDDSFLEKMKEWNIDKFDVIMGNPPYQDGSKDGGQNKIYNDFCKDSFSFISEKGKILFVTPISVLKKSKRFSLISKKGLKIVDFSSDNFFNVGIKICSWLFDNEYDIEVVNVISKNKESQNFDINDEILDTSEIDFDFFKIKKKLKEIASTPNKRMFLQNSVDATNGRSNIETDIFRYPVFKIKSGALGSEFVQFNKPTPKLIGLEKVIFSLTKSVRSYVIDTNDYDVNHMFTNVDNQYQIDNILSFILSEYFISHCEKWKKSDGYGFNNALKYLPPFDKNVKWNNEMVKNFIENY